MLLYPQTWDLFCLPAWAAGAIVVSVGSVGVVIAMVCFLIVVILATTDEAEVLPPVEEDESAKKPVDDAAQMYKNVDKKEAYREGYGEFWCFEISVVHNVAWKILNFLLCSE